MSLAPEQPVAGIAHGLYVRNGGRIYEYCLHRLESQADAEDATQTTFLNALRGLRLGMAPRLEAAWLFTIARNVCINHRRSTARRRRVETPRDLETLPDAVLATDPSPRDATVLVEALSTLPAEQRKILLLREVRGLSCKEIAEELDLTTSAVQMLLLPARRSMAERLRDLGREPKESAAPRCLDYQTQRHSTRGGSMGTELNVRYPTRDTGRTPGRARPIGAVSLRLHLLGAFSVLDRASPLPLPMSSQRVIAFLALHRRPLRRVYVAGSLWPETSDGRAAASLRSALWRIKRPGGLIEASGEQLRLHSAVQVDVFEVEVLARRELRGEVDDEVDVDPYTFVADLLPDWYDDWLLIERERFRQLRLCALDALCERFTRTSRFSSALEAGLLSVAGEPLRESAHSALVRAHLAQGNLGEALRQYRLCRWLFLERLGVEPTERLAELVASRLGLDAVGQGRDAA